MDSRLLMGFASLLWKEILRYLKVATQTVLSPVINAVLYMLIFGVSLGPHIRSLDSFSYLEFLIPGLLAMTSLNNALQNSASSIIISKFHGDLQDLRVLPIPSFWITLAYTLAGWTRAMICGAAVYAVGFVMLWISESRLLGVEHPFVFLYFLSLGAIFFGCVGIWSGFWASSFDQINVVTQFVVLPLIYLGGVFYSLDVLPEFWAKLAHFNPLVYLISGIRWSFIGKSDIDPLTCAIAAFVFVMISFLLAWRQVQHGNYLRF